MTEQREHEAMEYGAEAVRNTYPFIHDEDFSCEDMQGMFVEGVKWADGHPRKGLWDAEKVCKFLYEKVIDITYLNEDGTNEHYDKDEFIDDLRKEMEE